MLKIIFLVIIVIVTIAYTGIDVTSEYDDISKVRNAVFENLIDPLTKKALTYASESNLDEIFDSAVTNYEDKK